MGGKSGGSGHTPVEAPDSLRSSQTLSIIDVWCEGQIYGLATGDARSIYLNDTPVLDKNGDTNLDGVAFEYRVGTQDQDIIHNVPSIAKETAVGLELKHDTPLVRTVNDSNIDRLRVTLGVSGLKEISDENGDTNPTSVTMRISFNNIVKVDAVISGKTNSQYLRSYVFSDLPATPFTIKVERITPDSTSQLLTNGTLWQGYTEIVDAKLSYPNTALCGLKFDSEQFSGVPRRNSHLKGMIVRIPTNYDPVTRDYAGLWDGTFKLAYTNNPAWIFYDLVANERYGLGELIGGYDGVDKAVMYQISQYCDALVDDGYGSKEPRMTLNCWITEQKQAHQIISDLCSVFRGMPIWNGLQLSATIDKPQDTSWIYTQANVVDGKFSYQSSALKARHTACEVEYINPSVAWKKQVEHVQDDKGIARYGYNVNKITAFGCTSRGQARRLGRWLLETEKLERQTVSFSVGANGLNHLPGDVIEIADSNFAGVVSGGRVASVSADLFTITLDREINPKTAGTLTFINEHGKPERTNIVTVASDNKTVIIADAIQGTKRGSVWTLQNTVLVTRKFRAIGIKENDDGTYSINALQHIPEKQAIVDTGYVFDSKPDTIFGGDIPPVENLEINVDNDDDTNYQIRATWETPRLISDIKFQCELKTNTTPPKLVKRQTVNEMEFDAGALSIGAYTLTVRGLNNIGQIGEKQTVSFAIAQPTAPVEIITTADNFSNFIRPVLKAGMALGTQSEYFWGATEAEALSAKNLLGRGSVMIHQGLSPDTVYWYAVRTVNAVGRSALVTKNQKTANNPDGIIAVVGSQLSSPGFWRIETPTGIFPIDDAVVNSMFKQEFNKDPIEYDVLTIFMINPDGTVGVNDSKMYDGARWVTPALFVSGDLVADGTIKGQKLIAGISIEAPLIKGGRVEAAEVVSSGNPPKFSLSADGVLSARGANISGDITATSGNFSNVTIDGTCKVERIEANVIVGSLTDSKLVDVPEMFLPSAIPNFKSIASVSTTNNTVPMRISCGGYACRISENVQFRLRCSNGNVSSVLSIGVPSGGSVALISTPNFTVDAGAGAVTVWLEYYGVTGAIYQLSQSVVFMASADSGYFI